MSHKTEYIWACKIGGPAIQFQSGADAPMRQAVQAAFKHVTGNDEVFCFSGWGGELTEPERAVVENRLPTDEHEAEWNRRAAVQAAQPEAVGWKLVPVEPTVQMAQALIDYKGDDEMQWPSHISPNFALAAYRIMLAASPPPPVSTTKFANVSCSSCGCDFGPGDFGFSHCDEHAGTKDLSDQYLSHEITWAQYREKFEEEQATQADVGRPDIIERLSYHQMERRDLTLDDCLSYLAKGWRDVPGRTEREMVLQILELLAAAPTEAKPAQDAVDAEQIKKALNQAFVMGQSYWHDADSESYAANKRSDVTRQKFNEMRDELCAAISAKKVGAA